MVRRPNEAIRFQCGIPREFIKENCGAGGRLFDKTVLTGMYDIQLCEDSESKHA